MTDSVVIESDEYREEEARLKADPLIQRMAREADQMSDEALNDWTFTLAAMREAQRLGVDFQSVGGPARAIRAILKEGK